MWIKINVILIGVSLIYMITPLAIAILAIGLANVLGCSATGMDFQCPGNPGLGQLLTTMGMLHWFGVFTIPSGAIIAIILTVALSLQMFLPRVIR
ncbi:MULTISPECIES: hypothetical protein [Limnospira]|uniref:Uncharacterized protein n=3 Tax=Limnospira TaxID=2596745 RepID=A0A9P1P2I0_9CYAN|nr:MULTISPECIES: hypothetical protein [Limnospira]MDY7051981.1 hypothetical protein [Limnospira fusiformis LS22]QJB24678.1 hypothetical protein HFV01_01325 [Limnospira fusiformis SAG 85.79]MDT9190624.1 hypothetical protein [Limnospira sp. PMC 894.15]MDT9236598.1 hypothetical protein [Limnospira sp. PMC 917.15]QNH56961.1 MAG: hypothetical protein H2674_22875 [Limnospira indica BM01]